MKYRVVIQPRAFRDIDETCDYLSRHYSMTSAATWYDGCLHAIQGLATNPQRCQLARESARLGMELRQLLYRRHRSVHRILFVIRDTVVHVLCVRHAARDKVTRKDLPKEGSP